MCGIGGYLHTQGLLDEAVLRDMLARLRHRGPDGDGTWTSPRDGLALAHSRLMVQDLTPAAHQPMHSADGRVTLVYNGEIYNFRELRDELHAAGASFKSTGDTEVLLELCRRDPALSFLPSLNGMFAFAVWHAETRTLTLARDRTGVKPMLWAPLHAIAKAPPREAPARHHLSSGGRESIEGPAAIDCPAGIAFASEMHALRPALQDLAIDPAAVIQLLTLGFIAAPRTIFRNVFKLRPGHLLRYREGWAEVRRWAPPLRTAQGSHRQVAGATHGGTHNIASVDDACSEIRSVFSDAVRRRLLADVPVGVFLSGGIDSSIVTAVAASVAGQKVRTFSVSFPDNPFYDESRYAASVAKMHGTEHTVLPLSLADVQNIIPTVQAHIGEPFADSSVLPTYLLSRLTREHVTVALSGDGADELFAGYNRYAAATLIRRFGWFARTPLYGLSRRLIERLPARRETKLGGIFSQAKRAIRSMDPRMPHRHANWMRTSDDRTLARLMHDPAAAPGAIEEIVQLLWHYRYGSGVSLGMRPDQVIAPGSLPSAPWGERPNWSELNDLNLHLAVEWQLSLPDDMLTKVDLASMAHSLEVRSPFLDYRLVDLVMPMPWQWKLRGWKKKHLLVEAFREMLPPMLHNRPKKGFEVPVGPWLRGPLNGYARELIGADRCFFGTILSREGALATLEEHTTGRADHNFCLWALVSLLAWQQGQASATRVEMS